jgi:hypothetical protein
MTIGLISFFLCLYDSHFHPFSRSPRPSTIRETISNWHVFVLWFPLLWPFFLPFMIMAGVCQIWDFYMEGKFETWIISAFDKLFGKKKGEDK